MQNGFDICDVKLHTHQKPMTLQVQIRRNDSNHYDVSLEDCARLSGPIGEAIEASSLLSEAYVLEISSPGINEFLTEDRDFKTFKGFPVEVLSITENGLELNQKGLLHERNESHLVLNMKGKITRISIGLVKSVRLSTTKN